jgi:hypothetical protein
VEKTVTNDEFLGFVRAYVAEHPEIGARVADYATQGLNEALGKAYERAADMEVALVAAVSKKLKGAENIIISKLEKWAGKTSCRWDWYTSAKETQP